MRAWQHLLLACALATSACSAANGSAGDGEATVDTGTPADDTDPLADDSAFEAAPIADSESPADTHPLADSGSAPIDSGTTVVDAGSGSSTDSPVSQLLVEPDDGNAQVLAAINGAKKSLHIEVYLLTDATVIAAIEKAKSRGVDVKIVLEQNPYADAGANNSAQSKLTGVGIPVHWASDTLYALTHTKMMIVDGSTLVVMTLNLTDGAFSGNREFVVFDADAKDIAEAEAIFAADYAATKFTPSGRLVVSPSASETALDAFIDTAKTRIDIEMEELGSSYIDTHLESAAARGVAIHIVVYSPASSTTTTAAKALEPKGIVVRSRTTPTIHAKAIVVDGARAFIGSENLSTQSLEYNREVGLITSTPAVVGRILSTIEGDFTGATAI